MRLWMRCDGVLIRLRETRFFCRLTPPPTLPPGLSEEKRAALAASLAANAAPAVVVRESARREETFQALKVGEGVQTRRAPVSPNPVIPHIVLYIC